MQQAVRRIGWLRSQGLTFVVDADIKRFFENISHDRLMERLSRSLSEGPTTNLISLWLEHGAQNGRGVPQGSPLSPLLSNLFLDDLDEAFAGEGARIIRYADDFIIVCRTEKGAADALDKVDSLLRRSGLELNRKKTRITGFDEGFRFLGTAFVRSFAFPDPDNAFRHDEQLLRLVAERDNAEEELASRQQDRQDTLRNAGHDPGQRITYLTLAGRRLDARPNGFAVQEAAHRIGGAGGRDSAVGTDWRDILLLQGGNVDRIEIAGAVDVTRDAINEAFATETPLAFVNGRGETLGWASPTFTPRAGRQLAQAATALDGERKLALAQCFVEGRLRNQRAMLRRLNRERRDGDVIRALGKLNYSVRKIPHVASLDALRGVEGEATRLYWRSLSGFLRPEFRFRVRERPAREFPANILFNAAASMLLRDCVIALYRAGLHPGFGMLHETSDYRDAAAYDLAEEFRVALAEGPVLAAVNRGAINISMFSVIADGQHHASREAMAALIRAREQAAERVLRDPVSGEKRCWRAMITDQALRLAAHFETGRPYQPIVMDY
ncbi:MAG: CRISPR-associated endonuclease Cas1 [Nitratireductor sp.]